MDKLRTASSRAALVGNTYASLSVGDVVTTGRYGSDNGIGGGEYVKIPGAPPAGLETNPAYVPMADGWLRLLPRCGEIEIYQVGGLNDYSGSGTGGTDNHAPLMAAIAYRATPNSVGTFIGEAPYRIRFGPGKHKMNQAVHIRRIVNIVGTFVGPDSTGPGFQTQLYFRNTSGSHFVLYSANSGFVNVDGTGGDDENGGIANGGTGGTAAGSYLGGFGIWGMWNGTDHLTLNDWSAAIRCRASQVTVDRVSFHEIKGHGIHIHGAVSSPGTTYPYYGNANQCVLSNPWVHSCAGHAHIIGGNDANACVLINPQSENEVGGCGIFDGSALGISIQGGKIAGYGHRGIHKSGRHYQWIGTGFPSAVVPGTDDSQWCYIGDGGTSVVFLDWDVLDETERNKFWLYKTPIHIGNPYTTVDGVYVETGQVYSHTNSANVYGGTAGWTPRSANITGTSGGYFFGSAFNPASGIDWGDSILWRFGGPYNGDFKNGISIAYMEAGGNPRFELLDTKLSTQLKIQGRTPIEFTTDSTTEKMGGNAPQPYRTIIQGLAMRSTAPPYTIRFFDICHGVPAGTNYKGEYIAGSDYRNIDAGPGQYAMLRCTTSGVIADGAWASTPGGYGGGTVVSTTAGRYYRLEMYSASTIEPTHTSTSGPVTLADGAQWTYLGNSAPVFKGWGMIAS
jgi:hypothetical protein